MISVQAVLIVTPLAIYAVCVATTYAPAQEAASAVEAIPYLYVVLSSDRRREGRSSYTLMGKTRFCRLGHDKDVVGRYKRGCKACSALRSRKLRIERPRQYRAAYNNTRWKKRGMINMDGSLFTFLDYDRAFQTQQGKCKGCGIHQSALDRALSADHDHKTGIFRFLLCMNCNHALGSAQDDPAILRTLAGLLDTHHDRP